MPFNSQGFDKFPELKNAFNNFNEKDINSSLKTIIAEFKALSTEKKYEASVLCYRELRNLISYKVISERHSIKSFMLGLKVLNNEVGALPENTAFLASQEYLQMQANKDFLQKYELIRDIEGIANSKKITEDMYQKLDTKLKDYVEFIEKLEPYDYLTIVRDTIFQILIRMKALQSPEIEIKEAHQNLSLRLQGLIPELNKKADANDFSDKLFDENDLELLKTIKVNTQTPHNTPSKTDAPVQKKTFKKGSKPTSKLGTQVALVEGQQQDVVVVAEPVAPAEGQQQYDELAASIENGVAPANVEAEGDELAPPPQDGVTLAESSDNSEEDEESEEEEHEESEDEKDKKAFQKQYLDTLNAFNVAQAEQRMAESMIAAQAEEEYEESEEEYEESEEEYEESEEEEHEESEEEEHEESEEEEHEESEEEYEEDEESEEEDNKTVLTDIELAAAREKAQQAAQQLANRTAMLVRQRQTEDQAKTTADSSLDGEFIGDLTDSINLLFGDLYKQAKKINDEVLRADYKVQVDQLKIIIDGQHDAKTKGDAITAFENYVNASIKPEEPTIAGYVGKVLAVIAITLAVAIVAAAIGTFIAAGAPLTLSALGAAFTGFAIGLITSAKTSLIIAGASAGAAVIAGSASGLGIFSRKPAVERGTAAATQSMIDGLKAEFPVVEAPETNENNDERVTLDF